MDQRNSVWTMVFIRVSLLWIWEVVFHPCFMTVCLISGFAEVCRTPLKAGVLEVHNEQWPGPPGWASESLWGQVNVGFHICEASNACHSEPTEYLAFPVLISRKGAWSEEGFILDQLTYPAVPKSTPRQSLSTLHEYTSGIQYLN